MVPGESFDKSLIDQFGWTFSKPEEFELVLWTMSKLCFSKLTEPMSLPLAVLFQSHLYQGRTSGPVLFLLACIHPVTSCRAGWSYIIHGRLEFHLSMSSGSSMIAALCIQARLTHAHSFYLGIDDFAMAQVVSCCVYDKSKQKKKYYGTISYMFDCWANPVVLQRAPCPSEKLQ